MWGTAENLMNLESWSYAVYPTHDSGRNWLQVWTMDTMLLAGASVNQTTTIVGGSDGVLAIVSHTGIQEYWREEGGDIVAVDALGFQQIAVIESDDEAAVQRILWSEESSEWRSYAVRFEERVQSVKLIGPEECLVCTRHTIYKCRLNEAPLMN